MNRLPLQKQIFVLSALTEGNSIRATERLTGVNQNTIMKLLAIAGKKALDLHNCFMVNLKSNIIQIDEIWSYVAKKQKNLTFEERYYETDKGDQYTFVAIDAETKLVPCFITGKRNLNITKTFIKELGRRINTQFQLTSDSFAPYLPVIRQSLKYIDYAQVHKLYDVQDRQEKRYSPARIKGIEIIELLGEPLRENISTSYVERQNLTMRMQMRRFTRLTNAFSKKIENLRHAVALHFFHYNFMRQHRALRATPAMKAGISKSFWNWEQFLSF